MSPKCITVWSHLNQWLLGNSVNWPAIGMSRQTGLSTKVKISKTTVRNLLIFLLHSMVACVCYLFLSLPNNFIYNIIKAKLLQILIFIKIQVVYLSLMFCGYPCTVYSSSIVFVQSNPVTWIPGDAANQFGFISL